MKKISQRIKLSSILVSSLLAATASASITDSMYSISSDGINSINIMDPYGHMKSTTVPALASESGALAIATTPYGNENQFVFVAKDNNISVFKQNLDGSLALIKEKAVQTGNRPNFLAMDGRGRHLYATNESSNTVSMFDVDTTTGEISVIGTIATGNRPSSIVLNDTRAIVTNRDSNTISMYTIDPDTGALANRSDTNVGEHPILARIIKNKFVHVLNEGSNGASNISQFSLPETGSSLVKLQPEKVGVPANSQFMVTRGDEKYVFVTSKRSGDSKDSIQVLSVADSGTLTPIQTMISNTSLAGSTSNIKRSLTMDPQNKVLYATNAEQGTISSYAIEEATGKLNSTPVSVVKQTNPTFVIASDTTGEPDELSIPPNTTSVTIDKEYNADTADYSHDDAHITFTELNYNSHQFDPSQYKICITYNHSQSDGSVAITEECSEDVTIDGSGDVNTFGGDQVISYGLETNTCAGETGMPPAQIWPYESGEVIPQYAVVSNTGDEIKIPYACTMGMEIYIKDGNTKMASAYVQTVKLQIKGAFSNQETTEKSYKSSQSVEVHEKGYN